jgi:hypothetical protein
LADRPADEHAEPADDGAVVPYTPGIRAGSKQAHLVDLLYRPWGATVDELSQVLGWQKHTVRAAMTGLRKRGYEFRRIERQDGTRAYRTSPPRQPPAPDATALLTSPVE